MKPGATHGSTIEPIDYHTLRMLCFRAALADFLRRWGTYLGIALVVFSAGSNAPLTIASATTSALLWPLRDAVERGWAVVPMVLAYGLIGALPVVLTRPLWWPSRWAAAERALPLAAEAVRRSDRRFAAVLMAPWQSLLLLGGVGAWWHERATTNVSTWATVLVSVLVAASLSHLLSRSWMRVSRRAGSAAWSGTPRRHDDRRSPSGRTLHAIGPARALVLLPLGRGRAPRSAVATVGGAAASAMIPILLLASGLSPGWTAALLALVTLGTTSALRAATVRELQPLWRDHPALPFRPRRLEAMRIAIVLVPMATAVVAFTIACTGQAVVHRGALLGYAAALAVGCAIEATTPRTMDASNHAARWILLLAICIAFGSEIAPR